MRQTTCFVKVLRVRPRFHSGTVVVTEGVRTALPFWEIHRLLDRHTRGDWGPGEIGRNSPNERFLRWGLRLDSHYRRSGRDVLITTDPVSSETGTRRFTTVYLFEEYSRVHNLV
jgi:hypothetical protein